MKDECSLQVLLYNRWPTTIAGKKENIIWHSFYSKIKIIWCFASESNRPEWESDRSAIF